MLWQNEDQAAADALRRSGNDLPTTFGDTFAAAWSRNDFFMQNTLGEKDRLDALGDYLDIIKQKTGEDFAPTLDYGGAAGFMTPAAGLLEQANQKLGELKQKNPQLDLDPLSGDQLEQNAVAKRRAADADFAATIGRERGPGATAGLIAGGLAAGVADPINIVALPAAPEEGLGILANAFRWGLIGAGGQAASEAISAPYQEQVQPGYLESGAPLAHIAEAGAFTAGTAGLLRGLADTWERVSTGAWPTSVRQAGDVVTSQANIAASNVYPGAEGEAAHQQALSKAIDDILAGMPVRVDEIITPELEAQSRNLMARLEGQRAVSLPVFDERQIRLTSEEAGLRQQHAELGTELEGLPAGDISAADRLNRLQAVNAQLEGATGEMRRALLQRRDQILVDTTPEALQAAAEPIARRQAIGTQQGRIAGRLEEIAAERRQIDAQNLSSLPQPMIGQTEPSGLARAAPLEAIRTHAQAAAGPVIEQGSKPTSLLVKSTADPLEQNMLSLEVKPDAVHAGIVTVSPKDRGKGVATSLYQRAIDYAAQRGLPFRSDVSVSNDALRVYDSLKRKGYRITEAPGTTTTKAGKSNLTEGYVFEARPPSAPELPFEQTAAQGQAEVAKGALVSGVQQIARRAGYNMPADEAGQVAAKLLKQSPEEAADTLRGLQMSPRQVAEAPARIEAPAEEARTPVTPVKEATPELEQSMRADVDRERATGDKQIPTGIDADRNVQYRSLDSAMNEIDGYKTAAEQIAACAAPAPETAEAA